MPLRKVNVSRSCASLRFDGRQACSYHPMKSMNSAEDSMPKIRHLAIKTKDPAKLAKFYGEVFDMQVIHTSKSGGTYMSDGYLTLAILPNRGEAAPSGINHFGFQVDDIEDIEARLDPDGNLFDISVHGYDDVEYAADRQMKAKKAPEKQPA
jgi:predicted enzyme related to lactoylglutathione lyase